MVILSDLPLVLFKHWIIETDHLFQPMGKGKYVFDIGCEQHGEYIPIEQVSSFCAYEFEEGNIWNCCNANFCLEISTRILCMLLILLIMQHILSAL